MFFVSVVLAHCLTVTALLSVIMRFLPPSIDRKSPALLTRFITVAVRLVASISPTSDVPVPTRLRNHFPADTSKAVPRQVRRTYDSELPKIEGSHPCRLHFVANFCRFGGVEARAKEHHPRLASFFHFPKSTRSTSSCLPINESKTSSETQ